MKIIAATGNAGKIREIKKIFSDEKVEILSMGEIGIDIEIEENGTTFEENALIKARTISKMTGEIALADDSGLCVDAMGGAPGIYSARYAGKDATDAQRIEKLLAELLGEENRKAKFVSVIAVVFPDGRELTAEGEVLGEIADKVYGDGGFGYDPVFISDELGKTFGVASADEKNKISHRARALDKMYQIMKENDLLWWIFFVSILLKKELVL